MRLSIETLHQGRREVHQDAASRPGLQGGNEGDRGSWSPRDSRLNQGDNRAAGCQPIESSRKVLGLSQVSYKSGRHQWQRGSMSKRGGEAVVLDGEEDSNLSLRNLQHWTLPPTSSCIKTIAASASTILRDIARTEMQEVEYHQGKMGTCQD